MAGRNHRPEVTHRFTLEEFDGTVDWFEVGRTVSFPDEIEINEAKKVYDDNGMTVRINGNLGRRLRLAKVLRATSFTRTLTDPDADGGERDEPWPVPADEAGRLAYVDALDGELAIHMAIQVERLHEQRRVVPPDTPANPPPATPSSSASPSPMAGSITTSPGIAVLSSRRGGDGGTPS